MFNVTAVIPCRKGSTRCPSKNTRPFNQSNLLEMKINTLKQVQGITKILVSSNCDIAEAIAKKCNVLFHRRNEESAY